MGSLSRIGGPAAMLAGPISAVGELRPLPWIERLTLRRAFRGEQSQLGPQQQWLDRKWELRLASVEGIVYKVALEAEVADGSEAEELSIAVSTVLEDSIGGGVQQGGGIFYWDADDGNAVMQLAKVAGACRVMVFLTSRIARTFTPL